MARPEYRTNLQFIFDCIYYNLGQISHATGFKTDGYAVIMGSDPRSLKGSDNPVWKEKLASVSLKVGPKKRIAEKSNGTNGLGRTTWAVTYDYLILRTLKKTEDAAGVTCEDLEMETHDDLERLVLRDPSLVTAAAAVFAAAPAETYASLTPHIVDHKLDGIYPAEVQPHPDVLLVGRGHFEYSSIAPR